MVAVTKGAAGSEIHTPDGVIARPSRRSSSTPVDPTGAGDAYVAGLLTGFRAGATPDVAGRMGSVAAAYVVGERGPQAHHFTPDFVPCSLRGRRSGRDPGCCRQQSPA